LCLSKARIWISNIICHVPSFFVFSELRWEMNVCFVDIGKHTNHYYHWCAAVPILLMLSNYYQT
jgi:hypothetical protein